MYNLLNILFSFYEINEYFILLGSLVLNSLFEGHMLYTTSKQTYIYTLQKLLNQFRISQLVFPGKTFFIVQHHINIS